MRLIQAEIDRMQDTFDHTTRIAVNEETLALPDGKKPGPEAEPSGTA